MEDYRSRSADDLKALFTVLIGLALIETLKSMITVDSNALKIEYKYWYTYLALMFTILPFYQGNCKYLDRVYMDFDVHNLDGLIDFIIFIVHGGLLYSMALFITQPRLFFYTAIILLFVDVIWLAIVVYGFQKAIFEEIKVWLVTNFIVALLMIMILNLPCKSEFLQWIVLALIMVARTVVDYSKVWPFYWPNPSK